MFGVFGKFFDSNEKETNKLKPIVLEINSFEEKFKKLKDKDFPKKTKEFKSSILAERNKKIGRNLTFDLLSKIALKYKTRGEFQKKDSAAYTSARRQGFLEIICGHMSIVSFSIPQLIVKNILDFLLNSNSTYNDRKTIKPYEIDVYLPDYNLGFEYNGKGWHIDNERDKLKNDLSLLKREIQTNDNSCYNYIKNIK